MRAVAFAIVLAATFGAAVGLGRAVGPIDREVRAAHAGGDAHETALRLAAVRSTLQAGKATPFSFRLLDGEHVVREYDVLHARRMHLIVASLDLSEFHHLHPTLGADGVWRTTLRLARPGAYRAFADFSTGGERAVVPTDLVVPGLARQLPLSPEHSQARVDGYRVVLARDEADMLRFTVTRRGELVQPQQYLGARGHLVVLRQGDLEYLHTHPHSDELAFETDFPTPGRYRAFLQFRARGVVHTAPFTLEVGS